MLQLEKTILNTLPSFQFNVPANNFGERNVKFTTENLKTLDSKHGRNQNTTDIHKYKSLSAKSSHQNCFLQKSLKRRQAFPIMKKQIRMVSEANKHFQFLNKLELKLQLCFNKHACTSHLASHKIVIVNEHLYSDTQRFRGAPDTSQCYD